MPDVPAPLAPASPPYEGESAAPTVILEADDGPSESELRALAAQAALPRGRGTGEMVDAVVMMVDDEPLNLEITRAFLQQAGFRRFVGTHEPRQAIALMRHAPPGVLLLDLAMPGLGGMEILQALRDDAVLRHIPVIVLTGRSDAEAKLQALSLGAMDFLTKPVEGAELALRVRNILAAAAYRDYLANHDPLTGLPNKLRYRAEAAEALARARAEGGSGALLHVGVDGLGRINDALGRSVGDMLLQRVARRLASAVQSETHAEGCGPQLFRSDGDEFAILLPRLEGPGSAAAFINKLLEDTTVSFNRSGGQELFVTCSVGVTVFPDDGQDPDLLMRNAGLALRQAKQAGRHGCEFFAPQLNEQALRRLDLGAELRRAFARDEITLHYAPRVDVQSGLLQGAEAVVQWHHASGRALGGDELMELAGSVEMDVAMLEWVLEQVTQHARNWATAGLVAVPVGVKVPLAHVRPIQLARLVEQALASGLRPRDLALELQQSTALDGAPDEALQPLRRLRQKGVHLLLDRFGTPHASVQQLRRLQVDGVKVDPAFTRGLRDDTAQAVLLGIGDLAHRLGLRFVACGLHHGKQVEFLARHGWDQGQGPVFGAAQPGVDFAVRWLTRAGKPPRVASAPGIPGERSRFRRA